MQNIQNMIREMTICQEIIIFHFLISTFTILINLEIILYYILYILYILLKYIYTFETHKKILNFQQFT